MNDVSKYLKSRNVTDSCYILQYADSLQNKTIIVKGIEFEVAFIFSEQTEQMLGIKEANKRLGTDIGDVVTIGLLSGDDPICMDTKTGEIFFWLIENGDGLKLKVADSFEKLIKLAKSSH